METINKINFSNLGNILMAFALGVLVWFSATTANDPNIEDKYPNSVPLEIIGLREDKLITTSLPETVSINLRAPQSLWDTLNSQKDVVSASIDLTNYDNGDYMMPIDVNVFISPVDVIGTSPSVIAISIENKSIIDFPISTEVVGEPSLGYEIVNLELSSDTVQIKGAENIVSTINSVQARINILDKNESFESEISLNAFDEDGNQIENITIEPQTITAKVELSQSGGYRDVAVTLLTDGVPKDGYHVTNISYNPIIVTLYSANPDDVQSLPGYVNTIPLDITGADTNIQTKIALDLPANISVVSNDGIEQTIDVFVGIAATESSTRITLPVEYVGLNDEYTVTISPETADVIVSGPLTTLEELTKDDIHLYVDLTQLEEGKFTAQLIPEIINQSLKIESIVPEMVEVELSNVISPTQTPRPTRTSYPTSTPTAIIGN